MVHIRITVPDIRINQHGATLSDQLTDPLSPPSVQAATLSKAIRVVWPSTDRDTTRTAAVPIALLRRTG